MASEQARLKRNAYMREYLKEYYKKNPEKRKKYQDAYWEKKALEFQRQQQRE